jgi:hypothetical protein
MSTTQERAAEVVAYMRSKFNRGVPLDSVTVEFRIELTEKLMAALETVIRDSAKAVAEEREACAQVVEDLARGPVAHVLRSSGVFKILEVAARDIRARGKP